MVHDPAPSFGEGAGAASSGGSRATPAPSIVAGFPAVLLVRSAKANFDRSTRLDDLARDLPERDMRVSIPPIPCRCTGRPACASRLVGLPTGEDPVGRSTRTSELVLQPLERVRDRDPDRPAVALDVGASHVSPPLGVLRETLVVSSQIARQRQAIAYYHKKWHLVNKFTCTQVYLLCFSAASQASSKRLRITVERPALLMVTPNGCSLSRDKNKV